MTNLTKRAMADALKRLLHKRTLEHITVQDVADEADVSRKTFYYHFHDIYELVEWMLVEDCKALANGSDGGAWVQDLAAGLDYTTENQGWLQNIYASMDRMELERILRKIIAPIIRTCLTQALHGRPANEEKRQFMQDIFTYGVTGLFLSWMGEGMRSDATFLQDKLIPFFADSIQFMADRCAQETT